MSFPWERRLNPLVLSRILVKVLGSIGNNSVKLLRNGSEVPPLKSYWTLCHMSLGSNLCCNRNAAKIASDIAWNLLCHEPQETPLILEWFFGIDRTFVMDYNLGSLRSKSPSASSFANTNNHVPLTASADSVQTTYDLRHESCCYLRCLYL